jgi:DNA-binding transcriptional LysR family regulator
VVKVKDFNSVLVGGPIYKEYEGRVVYLEEVGKLPLITMSENTTTFQFFQEFYRSCGLTMRPSIEVASMDLILPIILKNLGIGFVPEEFARPLVEKGEIVEIKLYEQIPQRDICIVSDSKRPLSAAAKKLQYMLESRE